MTEYDERQKSAVLQALGELVFESTADRRMRLIIRPMIEIKDGGILRSTWWAGNMPSECLDKAFRELTQLPADRYVVLDADGPNRRGLRWNGFMWADVERRDPAAVVEAKEQKPAEFTDRQMNEAVVALCATAGDWHEKMRAAFKAAGARPS